MKEEHLTGSEAVYGLLGWLTSKNSSVTFSARLPTSLNTP